MFNVLSNHKFESRNVSHQVIIIAYALAVQIRGVDFLLSPPLLGLGRESFLLLCVLD